MTMIRSSGGDVIDFNGDRLPLQHVKSIALACQTLADYWADLGEIETASYYGKLATDLAKAGAEASRWARAAHARSGS